MHANIFATSGGEICFRFSLIAMQRFCNADKCAKTCTSLHGKAQGRGIILGVSGC